MSRASATSWRQWNGAERAWVRDVIGLQLARRGLPGDSAIELARRALILEGGAVALVINGEPTPIGAALDQWERKLSESKGERRP